MGTDSADRIRGTDQADVIYAGPGDDRVVGRGGDDVICGGAGHDKLRGNDGDDLLFGGSDGQWHEADDGIYLRGDHLAGGPGSDRLDVGEDPRRVDAEPQGWDTISFRRAKHRVRVDAQAGWARGEGDDVIVATIGLSITGSPHADVLLGTPYEDYLVGLGGDDRIRGRGGPDTLQDAIFGSDRYDRGSGADRYFGGAGNDGIESWSGRDVLVGGAGADYLRAESDHRAVMRGGPDSDSIKVDEISDGEVVDAGEGIDWVFLYPVHSKGTLRLDLEAGTLDMPDRHVTVLGVEALWVYDAAMPMVIHGSDRSELLSLSGGPVTAHLGGGDDVIYADVSDDTVDGGEGEDFADLNEGSDTCTNVESGPC